MMSGELASELRIALSQMLLSMADDELILSHRDSEWTGHAPILEEDIAFSNIAQDEMGHAMIWYDLLQDIDGHDPDRLVFYRDANEYRNAQLVELPNKDWAFSMMRQYLFDAFEMIRLSHHINSQYQPLAEAAEKIWGEELYHYRHTSNWVKRLGLGTVESNRRSQDALAELWGFFEQLFQPLVDESLLLEASFVPESQRCQLEWRELVIPFLESADLKIPADTRVVDQRRNVHTRHLNQLLSEMQEVARQFPDATW